MVLRIIKSQRGVILKKSVIIRIVSFLTVICIVLSISGVSVSVNAEENGTRTDKYVMQYLEITVPDSYIQLTSDLKDSDPKWLSANIDNPSERKDSFKNGNIIAAYYDPETHATVYFIAKSDNETLKAFDITGYSDSQIIDYASELANDFKNSENASIIDPAHKMKSSVAAYKHAQMNMFRLEFTDIGENLDSELIYGTIVNGMTIQFSMNTSFLGKIKPEVIQKVLDGVHLTTIMTVEEYEAKVRKTWTVIGCFFGGGILLMIILFVVSKINRKQKKKRVAAISEKLFAFRKNKQEGKIDVSHVLFTVETEYDKKLIQAYSTYNSWFKTIKRDIIMAVIYVGLVGYAIYLGSKVVMVLGIAGALILLYLRFSGNEKYQDNLIKRYDLKKKKSIMAEYRFYEDFFTLSGIDSISEYIYQQIYRVANYQGYMLLYISEESALVIDIEKVPEEERINFIRHIVEKSSV